MLILIFSMAPSSKILVMISSRCSDKLPLTGSNQLELSEIRIQLKEIIEKETLFGKQLFEVWINEVQPPQGGDWNSEEFCLNAVKKCDVMLVLYNGNAGWDNHAGIGICHSELEQAMEIAPGKIKFIQLRGKKIDEYDQKDQLKNQRFQEYVENFNFFRGSKVCEDVDDVIKLVMESMYDISRLLIQRGVRDAEQGEYHTGESLKWSQMSFETRKNAIIQEIKSTLIDEGSISTNNEIFFQSNNQEILFHINSIPDSLSISEAKEKTGQPFLSDYKFFQILSGKKIGPVHIIGCHKGITESQARKILGYPDAFLVNAPYGVYIADNIHKIQMVFLENCRNPTSTRNKIKKLLEWLENNDEFENLIRRAKSRKKIIQAISKEI